MTTVSFRPPVLASTKRLKNRLWQTAEREAMRLRRKICSFSVLVVAAGLLISPTLRAQDNAENPGVNQGNYNIQQTLEVGYRANWINGNQDTYDTFVNLGSGVRLLDYSVDMRSLDHNEIGRAHV